MQTRQKWNQRTLGVTKLRATSVGGLALTALLFVEVAQAAELEGTFRNLVTAFTGRLLPILAMGYLGKNIFAHIQSDPNAKNDSVRIVIAIACLLALSGVWSFISSQVR